MGTPLPEGLRFRQIGSLSNDVFERRTSNGSEDFSLSCLNATKFYRDDLPKNAKYPLPVDLGCSKSLCLNYSEFTLQLIDICDATVVNRPKCFKFFLGSYVIKFRQIHAPRTSQQFDPHIKIINLKYLMNFQLN